MASATAAAAAAPLMMRIVASSIQIAGRAGRIIRDVMAKGDLGIVEKGKDDLQTEADRSAQRCIMASLARLFPNVTIIGEEGKSDLKVIYLSTFDKHCLVMGSHTHFGNRISGTRRLVGLGNEQRISRAKRLPGWTETGEGIGLGHLGRSTGRNQ